MHHLFEGILPHLARRNKDFPRGRKTTEHENFLLTFFQSNATIGKLTACASGGIGRLAGFRCQCSQGRAGSTPASRTSSSQASYRLRRAILFHIWLIARSFCCSSRSAAIRFAGFAAEWRGRRKIVFLSHRYMSEQAVMLAPAFFVFCTRKTTRRASGFPAAKQPPRRARRLSGRLT